MSLVQKNAEIIYFECEACDREHSARALRKSAGACKKCHGKTWSMITEYQETHRPIGFFSRFLGLEFGMQVLNPLAEKIRIVTPAVPSDEAIAITKVSFFRRGHMAFKYMELRRSLDGERDRQIMREQGGQNCSVCGMFFMPSPTKPWTAHACCSKACLAKTSLPNEPQFVLTKGETSPEPTQSPATLQVVCPSGHPFRVAAMYAGTSRVCPTCNVKTKIP